MGIIAHELGHDICGLPDIYDLSNKNQGMGNFSLMGTGSWGADIGENVGTTPTTLDAWSREYLGWSTPVVPTATGPLSLGYSLTSPSSVYKLVIPTTSATEYFLVENRQPTSWDLGLRGTSGSVNLPSGWLGSGWLGGLLITHIDITAGTFGLNDINSYTVNATTPGHQGVVPVQASTATCNMLSVGATCRGDASTLFYTGNNNAWSLLSSPTSNYYNGAPTYFALAGISAPLGAMTANLTIPGLRTITVTKSGVGTGTVTSTPAAISCGSACSTTTLDGTPITFSAVADPGFVFANWTGAGCSVGTCQFYVSGNTTIDASFVIPTLSETFDKITAPVLPLNWSSALNSTATGSIPAAWTTNSGTVHPAGIASHSSANLVYFNSFTASSGNSATLISPPFSLSGASNGKVKFWMYRENVMNIYPDYVEVYVNSVGNLTGASLLGSVKRPTSLAPVEAADGWYEYSFAIPASFSSGTNYVLFKGISAYGNDIHIDDITVIATTVTGTTAQTITFGAVPSIVVGSSGTVSATGGASPNAVVFSSTTPTMCTVSGSAVTGLNAGTCIIAANQAGDATYSAAAQVTQAIPIGKGTGYVTLASLVQTYDGTAKSVTATTTPVGLTVTYTYNGSAIAPTAAGSYPVVAAISDTNYQGSATGTLNVAKAFAIITLGSLIQTYNGNAITVTVTTTPVGLAGVITYNGSPLPPVAVGSYPVVVAVNDANYQGSVAGTLTVVSALTTPTIRDVLKVQRSVVGVVPLTATEQAVYDVAPLGANGKPLGDGVITIQDANLILGRSLGLQVW
jgi:hypothetical protein